MGDEFSDFVNYIIAFIFLTLSFTFYTYSCADLTMYSNSMRKEDKVSSTSVVEGDVLNITPFQAIVMADIMNVTSVPDQVLYYHAVTGRKELWCALSAEVFKRVNQTIVVGIRANSGDVLTVKETVDAMMPADTTLKDYYKRTDAIDLELKKVTSNDVALQEFEWVVSRQ